MAVRHSIPKAKVEKRISVQKAGLIFAQVCPSKAGLFFSPKLCVGIAINYLEAPCAFSMVNITNGLINPGVAKGLVLNQ